MQPADIPHLIRQLNSHDADERRSASSDLGRLYAETQPADPPLMSVADLIGEINDQTADVAAPFIRQFTNPIRPLDQAWQSQTGTALTDFLSDMLCQQPVVNRDTWVNLPSVNSVAARMIPCRRP